MGFWKLLTFISLLLVVSEANINTAYKVHTNIHKYFVDHPESDVISSLLLLKDEVNVKQAVVSVPFKERGQVVFDVLRAKAAATQPPVIKELELLGVEYKPYWIVNMIAVKANYSAILRAATHGAIANIHPNFEFRVNLETPDDDEIHVESPNAIEWNINRVNAPKVWELGFRGKGGVVAGADTGVQWEHPALKNQYRGFNAETGAADHNYNWWDAVHATGSRCGANSRFPCDDSGHGTHTVGTMVGDDGAANQIGVAPDAKWVACRNMNAGLGTPQTYIECLQFFVAPTDLNGERHDPAKRPHVIGNSYGCPPSEGCVADSLLKAVENVAFAGIFMSVSAGNSGPSCSTVDAPPGTYRQVFSVGALGANSNTIASYSSRGPVRTGGTELVKPEISAPGSSVRSAYPTNNYASLSGTSMASPHISGIIALLWTAKPELAFNVEASALLLQSTALPLASTACGGNSTQNNVYGSGAVDVLAAVIHKD